MGIYGTEFGFPHLVIVLVVLLVFPYFALIIWAIDRFVRLNRRDRDADSPRGS